MFEKSNPRTENERRVGQTHSELSLLFPAVRGPRRRPPLASAANMRSALQQTTPPPHPHPHPHSLCSSRAPPAARPIPHHTTASKQPLPLHAVAAARRMPFKSGAPKCRWVGPEGHSFLIGVVHVERIRDERDGGDSIVLHTDQVSHYLFLLALLLNRVMAIVAVLSEWLR